MLGLELAHLEIDDDEAPQLEMEEQKVDVEIVALHLDVHLAPDERETRAELQQEDANMIEEPTLEVPLVGVRAECQEIEDVRVLQRLLRRLGSLTRSSSTQE
jgi:hypothetical protein